MLGGLRVFDEDGSRAILEEPLIVDIWGKEAIEEFYTVYPQIRNNYYDGPLAFYQLSNFGDMVCFWPNMQENVLLSIEVGVLVGFGIDDVYPIKCGHCSC